MRPIFHLESVFQSFLIVEATEILKVEHFRKVIMQQRVESPAILPTRGEVCYVHVFRIILTNLLTPSEQCSFQRCIRACGLCNVEKKNATFMWSSPNISIIFIINIISTWRHLGCFEDVLRLPMGDDTPDETKSELRVAINNIIGGNVY